jgi:hypothetical protein
MKKTVKKNISEMKSLVNSMPKTINEIINFEGNDDMADYDEEISGEAEPEEEPIKEDEGKMDVAAFVDDIRKKSLKGMASLAENPEDERYQLLKKIWQICDKKPEQQTAFGNPTNPQQPGQTMQQNAPLR